MPFESQFNYWLLSTAIHFYRWNRKRYGNMWIFYAAMYDDDTTSFDFFSSFTVSYTAKPM